jgi:anti-anti-sigma factor
MGEEYIEKSGDHYILHKQIDDIEAFEINGDFTIVYTERFHDVMSRLINEGKYKFIFDLSGTSFIDSAAIGIILMGYSEVKKHDMKIKVVGANMEIKNLLELVGSDVALDYFDSKQDAVNSFN